MRLTPKLNQWECQAEVSHGLMPKQNTFPKSKTSERRDEQRFIPTATFCWGLHSFFYPAPICWIILHVCNWVALNKQCWLSQNDDFRAYFHRRHRNSYLKVLRTATPHWRGRADLISCSKQTAMARTSTELRPDSRLSYFVGAPKGLKFVSSLWNTRSRGLSPS